MKGKKGNERVLGSVAEAIGAMTEAQIKVEAAAAEIVGMFRQVGDRPSVVRYSGKAFTDRDVNTRRCLDPFHYDFPQQAEYVAALVRQGNRSLLEAVLEKGKIRETGWTRVFHPQFIEQVRDVIQQSIILAMATKKGVRA